VQKITGTGSAKDVKNYKDNQDQHRKKGRSALGFGSLWLWLKRSPMGPMLPSVMGLLSAHLGF